MGAGKTTCARLLESDDTLIIDADAQAKLLMSESRQLQENLCDVFGGSIIDKDSGGLRFDALGRAAFQSAESLVSLNSVIHPPLVKHLERLVFDCAKPLCILDAALIPLWDIDSWFDLRVWVDAPFETRLGRLKTKRGDMDESELIRRMRLQEDTMKTPSAKPERWVRLPDSDCREYILKNIVSR
jgi:dephospho-CoA kinase